MDQKHNTEEAPRGRAARNTKADLSLNENALQENARENKQENIKENAQKQDDLQTSKDLLSNDKNTKEKRKRPPRKKAAKSEDSKAAKKELTPEEQARKDAKKRRARKARNLPKQLSGKEDWHLNLRAAIEANKAYHYKRLHRYEANEGNQNQIMITPLGGLGEIGGNISVIETPTDALILDLGMSFPDAVSFGVDIEIPNFDYIRKIKDKIRGIVITHAHEDHIGAVPFMFKEMAFPIYGTPLALGMISNKFEEHKLNEERKYFVPVEKGKVYKIGCFEVEWIHITHSIIDSSALAIRTPAGLIIHSGDFKIDHTPIDGYPTDLGALARYGDEGVLCLLSDSTNSHKEGMTKSESTVGPTFDNIFAKTKGRVIMSTFSSNIHRIDQAIQHGLKYGRKVCVIGRSMERNLFTAMELGYINLDKGIFIDASDVAKYKDEQVLVITTGSQGENMSALYRMAIDEHKFIKIKETDQIIISAKAIPGNETSVNAVLDLLLKAGAKVAYHDFSEIHVSGHASQEEQKLMINLIKPKFFLPVHGEFNHIQRHKLTAMSCGIPEKNIYLMSDGDQMQLSYKGLKRARTIKTGKHFIDNQINEEIPKEIIDARRFLADNGIIILSFGVKKKSKTFIQKPKITSYGLVQSKANAQLSKELSAHIEQFVMTLEPKIYENKRLFDSKLRELVKKYLFKKFRKYPTISASVFLA